MRKIVASANAGDLLRGTFEALDERLRKEEYAEYQGTTATVAVAWMYQDKRYVQVAHVGDSTAFIHHHSKVSRLLRLLTSTDGAIDSESQSKRGKRTIANSKRRNRNSR